jgi:hypothetical protein
MAEVLGLSWPIPFVVPPWTQSANLRNRHKVQGSSGSDWPQMADLSGSFTATNLQMFFHRQEH